MNLSSRRGLLWAFLVAFLAGCAAPRPAPVQNRPIPGEPAQGSEKSAPGTKPQAPGGKESSATPHAEIPAIVWAWPLAGSVPATYSPMAKGLDFDTKRVLPVHAAADGVVSYVGDSIKSYGEMVVIKHSPDYLSVYANNSKVLVKEGETVKRGQKIAETGGADASKWHFEIRRHGKPVDPDALLPKISR